MERVTGIEPVSAEQRSRGRAYGLLKRKNKLPLGELIATEFVPLFVFIQAHNHLKKMLAGVLGQLFEAKIFND